MSGKIIPRWEWRTFGESFGDAEDKIKAYPLGNSKKSDEKYILSTKSDENCKIRDDLMDVKSLQQVDDNKFEQWYPALKEGFPISKDSITNLFKEYFKVDVPEYKQDSYSYEEFLALVGEQKDLRVVDVWKERFIYTINMAIVEIANVKFDGVGDRTVCVEHTDPEVVLKTVKELGLEGYPNINYIQAMKKSVGLKG